MSHEQGGKEGIKNIVKAFHFVTPTWKTKQFTISFEGRWHHLILLDPLRQIQHTKQIFIDVDPPLYDRQ